MSAKGWRLFVRLLPLIGIYWLFLFVRVYQIEVMPLFVDEIRHISRAGVAYEFSDLDVNTTPRKFLLYYLMGLFGMPDMEAHWMGRIPIPLFGLLGVAATFAIAHRLFNDVTAYGSAFFLCLFPFLVYHERLALSDPPTATFAMLMIWWSLVILRKPTYRGAYILGTLITLMLAAKTLGLPYLAMPVLAITLLGPHAIQFTRPLKEQIVNLWHIYYPYMWRAALVVVVFWVIVLIIYGLRLLLAPDDVSPIVNRYLYAESDQGTNISRVGEILRYYWGVPLAIFSGLTIPLLVYRYPREAGFLIIGIFLMWLALILTANRLSSRYTTLAGHLWAIVMVAGAVTLKEEFSRLRAGIFAWAPVIFVLGWSVAFGGNFWLTLADDPAEVDLPSRDKHEYFANQSGYGVPEMVNSAISHYRTGDYPAISNGKVQPVLYGIKRNCSFIPYHIEADTPIDIECYIYTHQHSAEWPDPDEMHIDFNKELEHYGALYLLAEQFQPESVVRYEQINGCMVKIDRYQRPYEGVILELYSVYTPENTPPDADCVQSNNLE